MTTALDLIKDALREIGVLAVGETLSFEEANDALRTLNRMRSSWNTEKLKVNGIEFEEFTLIPGQSSYTIGSGGDFDTSRPVHVEALFIKGDSDTKYPVEIIDHNRWGNLQAISSESSIPTKAYIDKAAGLKTVYLYPTPSEAKTIVFHNRRRLEGISSLTTIMVFADGEEEAVLYGLAKRLAPSYGVAVSVELADLARDSLADFKRANIEPKTVGCDPSVLSVGNGFDIRTGE